MGQEMADHSKKILIVEDDVAIRCLLEFALLTVGYQVYQASDGAKALMIVKEYTPDLIITDVKMPVVDGYELIKNLKECPDTSRIPVILMTAGRIESERVENFPFMPDDYLRKPFTMGELQSKVEKLLTCRKE